MNILFVNFIILFKHCFIRIKAINNCTCSQMFYIRARHQPVN